MKNVAKSMEKQKKNNTTNNTNSCKNSSYINIFCESVKTLNNVGENTGQLKACVFNLLCYISTENNILEDEYGYFNAARYAKTYNKDKSTVSKAFKQLINFGVIRKCDIKEIYTETNASFQVYVFNPYIAQPPGSVDEHIYKLFDDTPFLNKESLEYKKSRLKSRERTISLSLRYDVLKRDNFTCQVCGRTISDGAKLEVDHRVPIAKGGKSTMDNLWTLCFECNRGKSTKK